MRPEHKTAYEAALAFVQQKHAGQMRAGGVPTWHHLVRVSHLLQGVLEEYAEGTEDNRQAIVLAALGHDVLEDTDATRADVHSVFGERAAELIWGMTNE